MASNYQSWNEPDLPSGILRQRRNLLIFSIGTIVFVVAGGVPPDTVSLPWSGVSVTRPWVLAIAWCFGFWYAYFRFNVYQIDTFESLKRERLEALYALSKFQEWLSDQIEHGENPRPRLQFRPSSTRPERIIVRFDIIEGPWGSSTSDIREIRPTEIETDFSTFRTFWKSAKWLAARRYKTTTDIYVPVALAYAAAVLLVWRVYADLVNQLL